MIYKGSLIKTQWYGINFLIKKIPLINNKFFKKFYIKKLIINIKAYNQLKLENNISLKKKLLLDIEKYDLNLNNDKFSKLIFGNHIENANNVIKQNILYYFIQDNNPFLFTTSLLKYIKDKKKISYPLPSHYFEIFEKFNLEINKTKSLFYWYLTIIIFYFYGNYKIIITLIKSFNILPKKNFVNFDESIYLFNLTKNTLPNNSCDLKNKNLINWLDKHNHLVNVKFIFHSLNQAINIEYKNYRVEYKTVIENLNDFKSITLFFIWSIKTTLLCLFDIFRGRWWHAFLLHEAVNLKIISLQKNKICKKYFFNNSVFIKRPLWTYEAEKKGSEIIFYFYSTNSQNYLTKFDDDPTPFGWKNTTWPNYLIWDKYQKNFLNNYTYNSKKINIVGPIWFEDNGIKFIKPKKKFVSIFDISPTREVFNKTLIISESFPSCNYVLDFLNDIQTICENNDIIAVLKYKRSLANIHHPTYIKYLNKFIGLKNTILLDPAISSVSIIEQSQKVISAPFSSTSIISKHLNIPSIYYDPHSIYLSNNPVAHNIEIIKGKDKLEKWLINS